ncbi:hypothetical protein As57867_015669, partial [Aphanomyces stellatus]
MPSSSRMNDMQWKSIANGFNISPAILRLGLPPAKNRNDSYDCMWMKLLLEEFHTNLNEFKKTYLDTQAHTRLLSNTMVLVQYANAKSVLLLNPEDPATVLSPNNLCKTLLKHNDGWIYVKHVEGSDTDTLPALLSVVYFTEDFVQCDAPDEFTLCQGKSNYPKMPLVLFDSFSTLIYRFRSLSLYPTAVAPSIKAIIEDPVKEFTKCIQNRNTGKFSNSVDLPPPLAHHVSKLNTSQHAIMLNLATPVEFVQGPPGTGKSTFIVELLETRIPKGARVLMCTTTNKAIDSLTEKIARTHHRETLLAVGNETRLGETSKQYLLHNRVANHPATVAMADIGHGLQGVMQAGNRVGDAKHELQIATVALVTAKNDGQGQRNDDAIKALQLAMDTAKGKVRRAKASLVKRATEWLESSAWTEPALDDFDVEAIQSAVDSLRLAVTAKTSSSSVLCRETQLTTSAFGEALRSVARQVEDQIIAQVRCVVCTAACAATLQRRLTRVDDDDDRENDVPLHMALAGLGLAERRADIPFEFSHVVLDEAGAMLEPDVIGTIIHGCRFLLCVGDHLQLAPFTKWRHANEFKFTQSLLERLADASSDPTHNMMTTQYRMHPAMADVVSFLVYRQQLSTASIVATARRRATPLQFIHVNGREESKGTSFLNEDEMDRVVEVVRRERTTHPTLSINVICFHKPQYVALQRLCQAEPALASVDVVTVDAMQGREADVVVLSCVRTDGQ